jgi:hypothetical protein
MKITEEELIDSDEPLDVFEELFFLAFCHSSLVLNTYIELFKKNPTYLENTANISDQDLQEINDKTHMPFYDKWHTISDIICQKLHDYEDVNEEKNKLQYILDSIEEMIDKL